MIKEFILNKSMLIINNKYNYNNEKYEEIRYGLEGIYLTISKSIIIFLLALILDLFNELLILLFFYNLIRAVSFGLHAKNSIICLLSSTIIFLGVSYISKYIVLSKLLKIILFITCTFFITIFSPADTEKRPIISNNRRMIYKILSFSICIIYMIIGLITKNNFISNTLLFSLIIQVFLINPLSYKITNSPYNNYKNYIKE